MHGYNPTFRVLDLSMNSQIIILFKVVPSIKCFTIKLCMKT